jgi:hypothetical protein
VKIGKLLRVCGISPAKTVGGLTVRQRHELVVDGAAMIGRAVRAAAAARGWALGLLADVLFGRVGPGPVDYPATASTPACPECRDTGISLRAHARGGGWRRCGCRAGRAA